MKWIIILQALFRITIKIKLVIIWSKLKTVEKMLTRSANGVDFAPRLADIQLFRNSFISEAALDSYEYDELWGDLGCT